MVLVVMCSVNFSIKVNQSLEQSLLVTILSPDESNEVKNDFMLVIML